MPTICFTTFGQRSISMVKIKSRRLSCFEQILVATLWLLYFHFSATYPSPTYSAHTYLAPTSPPLHAPPYPHTRPVPGDADKACKAYEWNALGARTCKTKHSFDAYAGDQHQDWYSCVRGAWKPPTLKCPSAYTYTTKDMTNEKEKVEGKMSNGACAKKCEANKKCVGYEWHGDGDDTCKTKLSYNKNAGPQAKTWTSCIRKEWFCVANINRKSVTGPFETITAAKKELNKFQGNAPPFIAVDWDWVRGNGVGLGHGGGCGAESLGREHHFRGATRNRETLSGPTFGLSAFPPKPSVCTWGTGGWSRALGGNLPVAPSFSIVPSKQNAKSRAQLL